MKETKNKPKPGSHSLRISIAFIFLLSTYLYSFGTGTELINEFEKPRLAVQLGHSQPVFWAAFSFNGKYLATSSVGKNVLLWHVDSGRQVRRLKNDTGAICSISFIGKSYQVLLGSINGKLQLWDIETDEVFHISDVGVKTISTMAASDDGRFAVTLDMNSILSYWDIKNRKLINNFSIRPESSPGDNNPLLLKPTLNKMAFRMILSKDGNIAVIGMLDDSVRILDLTGDRGLRVVRDCFFTNDYLAFSDDGMEVLLVDCNGIRARLPIDESSAIWYNDAYAVEGLNEKTSNKPPKNFLEEKYSIPKNQPKGNADFIFSAEKGIVLLPYHGIQWKLVEVVSGKDLKTLPRFPDPITPLKFVPNQYHVLGVGKGGNLLLVDLNSDNIIQRYERQSLPLTSVTFNKDQSEIIFRGKENRVFSKFNAVTSSDKSLENIKTQFSASPWVSVWGLQSGRQLRFNRSRETERDANHWAIGQETGILRSKPKDPIRIFYDSLLQIQFDLEFPAFVKKARINLENPEDLNNLEIANMLWLEGESSAAHRKLAEALKQYMTPELKKAFDDIELRFERLQTYFSVTTEAIVMANQRQAVSSSDNLIFAVAEDRNINLYKIKKLFSTVLREITPEHFKDDNKMILLLARAGLSTLSELKGHSHKIQATAFSPDDKSLATIANDGEIKLWDIETEKEIDSLRIPLSTRTKRVLFDSGGNNLLLMQDGGDIIGLEKKEKKQIFKINVNSPGLFKAAGFDVSMEKQLVVLGFPNGTARLYSTSNGNEICSFFSFIDGTWVLVDPQGRFDTNNLEEIKGLSWLMPDEPLRPWPLEVYMRDYFEPMLLPRLLGLKNKKLKPVPPLSQLNRVQPYVGIDSIVPDRNNPGQISVTVEVAKATEEYGRGDEKKVWETGVYDLRLFRDGQIVGYMPKENGEITVNPVTGKAAVTFDGIKIPRRNGNSEIEISAYAFNVSGVKSKTARKIFNIPRELSPVKGTVYLVTVGVNAYENSDWDLQYAANDAEIIRETLEEKLQKTGEFKEVVSIPLISDFRLDGGRRIISTNKATRRNVKAVLDLLAGKKVDNEFIKAIPNAGHIREANPEDLVFISFSCHGDTDDNGIFYLFPYDIGSDSDGNAELNDFSGRCISSDDLSLWLRDVDAGDMVMIVDACYSAAAVETEGFKPGPMGSKGLGQLAYNKGMYVLAASQADNRALEHRLVKHGILTYALIHDGISKEQADFKPKDGRITLSEWLQYGVERVPILYRDIQKGKVRSFKEGEHRKGSVIRMTDKNNNILKKRLPYQQPTLFNFKKKNNDITLISLTGEW